ncbi:hypothetical protein ACWGOQ_0010730 [Aquimarina sp. M1]
MSTLTKQQDLFHPSNPDIKKATQDAFKKIEFVDKGEAENFLTKLEGSVPTPLGAKASLIFAGIYGNITVQPTSGGYENWKFDESFWGAGAVGGSSIGFMYTAYSSWDAFFKNVTSFHVQSVASGGGILQVNFFISNGTPVGQFNGALAGAGAVEGGSSGKWKKA